jgi:hypothetical protein
MASGDIYRRDVAKRSFSSLPAVSLLIRALRGLSQKKLNPNVSELRIASKKACAPDC